MRWFVVFIKMNTSKANKLCKNYFSEKGCKLPYCNNSHLFCRQLSQHHKIGEFKLVIECLKTSGRKTKQDAVYKLDIVTNDFISFKKEFYKKTVSIKELHNYLLIDNNINNSMFRYNDFKLLIDEIIKNTQATIYTIFLLNNSNFVIEFIELNNIIKDFYKCLYRQKIIKKRIYKIEQ